MPSVIRETPECFTSPKIIRDGAQVELAVSGEYAHTRFLPGTEYTYTLKSVFFNAASLRRNAPVGGTAVADAAGTLRINFEPDITGEWILNLESEKDTRKHMPVIQTVFVLPHDLYRYRPYIGELHSHSTASDGMQEPAYPPMRARIFGYDFFALTDHWSFESSERMIAEVGAGLGHRMVLLTGEEMHPETLLSPPEERTHAHHFHYTAVGHRQSVLTAFRENEERTRLELGQIRAELEERGVRPDVDLEGYAEGVWKVRKAKEFGGIVLYAHPYWNTPVNLDAGAIEQTFADRECDAVEAFTPADWTAYMANRLASPDLAADPMPVVGVSDAHDWGVHSRCRSFTLCMAVELSRDGILDAVREGRCVACGMIDPVTMVGPWKLIDFANYYIHRILPLRRRITEIQGNLALSRLRGGAFSRELVDALDRDLDILDARIWDTRI